MKRPLLVYIFTILTSLVVACVLAMASLSKDVYLDLFGIWYWYTTIALLTAWIVSMVGVFYLRIWAVISSVIILLLHQIVLVFAGAWSLSKLPMLVVPVAFFVWLHCTKRLTIRLSKDALCLALGRKECKLNRWREIFEQSAMNVPDKEELEIRYQFGQPSTESELATLEHQLGGPIPTELRSMLKEFNGIEIKEKDWGESWRPLYLSIAQILLEVVDYIETSGNPMPASDELANVVFFAHQNGFAELYAVCMRDFSEFRSGQILVLDHETGELQLAEESLSAFVSNPDYCTL